MRHGCGARKFATGRFCTAYLAQAGRLLAAGVVRLCHPVDAPRLLRAAEHLVVLDAPLLRRTAGQQSTHALAVSQSGSPECPTDKAKESYRSPRRGRHKERCSHAASSACSEAGNRRNQRVPLERVVPQGCFPASGTQVQLVLFGLGPVKKAGGKRA